jgi:hypothetical protein
MIAAGAGYQAQVVVGHQPRTTLPRERTDAAVRNGLGIRRPCRLVNDPFKLPHDVPVQGSVATQIDWNDRPVAENQMGERGFDALNERKEAVVETELVHDMRLYLAGELGVDYLVAVLAESRADRHTPQEVGTTLPVPAQELRLVDQRRPLAHGLSSLEGGGLELLAREPASLDREIAVSAALDAQPLELSALVSLAAIADEIGVGVIGRPGLRSLSTCDRKPLLGEVRASEIVGQVRRRQDQRAVS